MRTFITLEFTSEIKNKIKEVQDIIRQNSFRGSFKHMDNFHLTLKFLGESTDAVIEGICRDLIVELEDFKKIQLNLKGLGIFGENRDINTIYIDVSGDVDKLSRLQGIVDLVSNGQGYKQEKRYTPHITIAQKVALKLPFNELCMKIKDEIASNIVFNEVVIMKSEQLGNRRLYTPLKKIPLGN